MDQFRQLMPGEFIPGLPHEPWNKFLDREKGHPRFQRPEGLAETSVEIDIRNNDPFGNVVQQFGILHLQTPLNSFDPDADDNGDFYYGETWNGYIPSFTGTGLPFVVIQETAEPGEVVRGRLIGQTTVKVDLTDTSHRFANAVNSDFEKLHSAGSGPAAILWIEDNFTETGEKWAKVLLEGPQGTIASDVISGQGEYHTLNAFPTQAFAVPFTDAGTYEVGINAHVGIGGFVFPPQSNSAVMMGYAVTGTGTAFFNIVGMPLERSSIALAGGWGGGFGTYCPQFICTLGSGFPPPTPPDPAVRISFTVQTSNTQSIGSFRFGWYRRRLS